MLIYEYKIQGNKKQYAAIERAIRTTQFIRNKCLRLWMDTPNISKNDLQCYCAVLAKEYDVAICLNSQARQAAADRAWSAISRFYSLFQRETTHSRLASGSSLGSEDSNCKNKKPGKKGYPKFQHDNRSVEYKTTGWRLEPNGKHIVLTDGCGIGRLRMIGTRDLASIPQPQIRRVRLLRRADGYYIQFGIEAQRQVNHVTTGKQVGIDVGLKSFLTDSEGNTVENPRHYRKAEKRLKRLHRRHSRKVKKSANRKNAQKVLAKGYLKVQRQREDFARKQAKTLVSSHDLIAYENLNIRNMVRNRKLAKSIQDAGWGIFMQWLTYYGAIHGISIIAVAPNYTSQDCSKCATRVKKSLSVRTHICPSCGLILDRDQNAALNILKKAHFLSEHLTEGRRECVVGAQNKEPGCTVGHTETGGECHP